MEYSTYTYYIYKTTSLLETNAGHILEETGLKDLEILLTRVKKKLWNMF